MPEGYISAAEIAKRYGVSITTVRRRIAEGRIFPGAVKEKAALGEMWYIPRAEAERATLKDISPKVFQEKNKESFEPSTREEENRRSSEAAPEILEDRVARLERLFIKYLDSRG